MVEATVNCWGRESRDMDVAESLRINGANVVDMTPFNAIGAISSLRPHHDVDYTLPYNLWHNVVRGRT